MNRELNEVFYRLSLQEDRQRSYQLIVDFIMQHLTPQATSAIDYGCGAGWVLYYLKKFYTVLDIVGIDPNEHLLIVIDDEVKDSVVLLDLREDIQMGRKYDLAICMEVVEHIAEEYAERIVDNITRHSDVLIFAAAYPGQGGYGHINEQSFEYWEEKLNKRNFYCDKENTQKFRAHLRGGEACFWYYKNLSVFVRGKVVLQVPDKMQLKEWDSKERSKQLQEYWGNYDQVETNSSRQGFVREVNKMISFAGEEELSILDVGCGAGHNLWVWKDKNCKLIGLEYSEPMLELTRREFQEIGKEIELIRGSCWDIPKKDNSVDIVVQMDVCIHLGGMWESILEMLRVAKSYVLFTGSSFEYWDDRLEKRIRGKLAWGVSTSLLEEKLTQEIDKGNIVNFRYLERPNWSGFKHRILVIKKRGEIE